MAIKADLRPGQDTTRVDFMEIQLEDYRAERISDVELRKQLEIAAVKFYNQMKPPAAPHL